MKSETKSYLVLLALALVYDLLFTFPPILMHLGINADLLYTFFKPVCHQIDARSFHIFGYKLAVCSRCASIYYGFTFGIILYPFFRPLQHVEIPNLIFLVIPLIALIADFSLDYTSAVRNTFMSRSITGSILGISLAFYAAPVWISLLKEFKTKRLLPNEE